VVRVRYAETDQMQVVYHANYFIWFEVGRTDLLRDLGWSYREMAPGSGCPSSKPAVRTIARRDTMMRSKSARRAGWRRPCGWRLTTRPCGAPTAW
jgi:hypothetical protein